jgi:hypothetical protein
MRLMEGEHVRPFNLGEFTMLELAQVCLVRITIQGRIDEILFKLGFE